MQRVIVGGISGAGKTTLALALSRTLELPYVDFDALFHGPGWSERPTFLADVEAFVATDRWVTDSDGYQPFVGDRVWSRADTFVWLDYPRPVVMRRVIRRTLRRTLLRQRLFNGNRERFLAMVLDPEHPVRWAWSQHADRRRRNAELVADPRFGHLTAVRLRRPRDTRRWLREISGA
jgi:adenylate kinase family enzyme